LKLVFLRLDGDVFDYELKVFADVAAVLDRHIHVSLDETDLERADQMGLLYAAEHATGLGFAACQVYVTATCGFLQVAKDVALKAGPTHAETGKPIVEIVNAAANHWKHSEEWPQEEKRKHRREEILASLGCLADEEYPLSNVLAKLTHSQDKPLSSLVPLLAAWRDSIDPGAR
jgi:hypothetical protein